MSVPQSSDGGALIQAQPSIFPQSTSGTTAIKGAGVNRLASDASIAGSCTISARSGVITGTPTKVVTTFKIQHSVDNVDGDYADYIPPGASTVAQVVLEIDSPAGTSADNTSGHLDVDLNGANAWVRLVETPAFTDGSDPTVPVSADIVLSGFSGGQAVPVPSYS